MRMCLGCGVREVRGEYSHPDGSGFCSAECERVSNPPRCVTCGEFVTDGTDFCSRQCKSDYFFGPNDYPIDEPDDPMPYGDEFDATADAAMSHYDDDPNPYDGTYSEE